MAQFKLTADILSAALEGFEAQKNRIDTRIAEIRATLRPEVHVKGGDYTLESLPEARIVRSYGGEVVILPTLEGRSTTSVLKKLGLS